jgi:hypothetical protein
MYKKKNITSGKRKIENERLGGCLLTTPTTRVEVESTSFNGWVVWREPPHLIRGGHYLTLEERRWLMTTHYS